MNHRLRQTALACATFAAVGASHSLAAPFTVLPTDNATMLAQAILGAGITIVGIPTLSSQTGQSGVFANFSSGQYFLPTGVFLTTGLATALRGSGGIAAFRVEANASLTPLGIFGVGGGLPVADGASGMASY